MNNEAHEDQRRINEPKRKYLLHEMMYLVGMNDKDKEYMIKKSRHFAVPAGSYSQEKSIKLSYRGF